MNPASRNIQGEPVLPSANSFTEFSDEQFGKWISLIHERTGMHLSMERKSFLTTNIKARMRKAGFRDYETYYEFVTSGPRGMVEWVTLMDHLTVQETCFNRHVPSFDAIRNYCRNSIENSNGDKPVSIHALSMGCATGEEAYMLAMVLDSELSAHGNEKYFGVTACDISNAALTSARTGIYGERNLKKLPPEMRDRYLSELKDGAFQINQDLRQRVCFSRLNITGLGNASFGDMDIVMCQNLLIYFEHKQREQLLELLSVHLKPGGILVLGVGEVIGWKRPGFERVNHKDTLIYRRIAEGQEGASDVNG